MTALNFREASFDSEFISRPTRVTNPRRSASGALVGWVAAFGAPVREYLRRRRVMAELSRLSDRELADIGVSRSEIGLIYSEKFAARRNVDPNG